MRGDRMIQSGLSPRGTDLYRSSHRWALSRQYRLEDRHSATGRDSGRGSGNRTCDRRGSRS